MAEIFEKAAVTICGTSAYDAEQGFLHERSKLTTDDLAKSIEVELTLDGRSHKLSLALLPENRDGMVFKETGHALSRRAWITQDRLLSPRVLCFGKDQMYMGCKCADFHESWRFPQRPGHYGKPAIGGEDRFKAYREWCRTISGYSACDITERDDRLPALSGTAQRYGESLHTSYHAGLWKEWLAIGLAWRRHVPYPNSTKSRRRSERAWTIEQPSWSWVYCDYKVSTLTWSNVLEDIRQHPMILDIETIPVGLDPYGQVRSGRLTLRTKTKQAPICRVVHTTDEGDSARPKYTDFVASLDDTDCALQVAKLIRDAPTDDPILESSYSDTQNEIIGHVTVALIVSMNSRRDKDTPWEWAAMVLEQEYDESHQADPRQHGVALKTYRRIGLMYMFRGGTEHRWEDDMDNLDCWNWIDSGDFETFVVV